MELQNKRLHKLNKVLCIVILFRIGVLVYERQYLYTNYIFTKFVCTCVKKNIFLGILYTVEIPLNAKIVHQRTLSFI